MLFNRNRWPAHELQFADPLLQDCQSQYYTVWGKMFLFFLPNYYSSNNFCLSYMFILFCFLSECVHSHLQCSVNYQRYWASLLFVYPQQECLKCFPIIEMLALGLRHKFLLCKTVFINSYFIKCFNQRQILNFIKDLFSIYRDDHDFSVQIYSCSKLYQGFPSVKLFLLLKINPT